jgi:SAM-dependent methyltransferase
MKRSFLQILECPTCHAEYTLTVDREHDGEVMEGSLSCRCGISPIHGGVPRILPKTRHEENWKTSSRFGEEWTQFDMLTEEYEKQFLSWIEPVRREDFVDKTVLDVGSGKGRHILQAKKFGADQVVGVDLSHAVDVAFKNVGRMPGVHILQADIYSLPFKPVIDYAYSIGVLHHTPDPAASFQKMVDTVKPGGTVSAWVYGREGNGWIIYLLNPIRYVTARLPLLLTKILAFVLACILQAGLFILYRPAEKAPSIRWMKKILPYSAYLCSISGYSFRENFSIVFDHLLPEIAFYIPRPEFQSWFDRAALQDVAITQRYGNSWRGFGRKPTT